MIFAYEMDELKGSEPFISQNLIISKKVRINLK